MKTTEEIYQALLAAFAQRAGFTPEADCDLSVRLYAAAAELQALGIQGEWVLDAGVPVDSIPELFIGVVILFLAEVFHIGYTMSEEQKWTV